MEQIAIIGGGHVGISLFCDLLLRVPGGSERSKLFVLSDRSQVRAQIDRELVFNDLFNGTSHPLRIKPNHISTLYGESQDSLARAGAIFVTVPDIPFVRPHILDHLLRTVPLADRLLVFCRGGQAGTPYLAQLIRNDPRLHDTHTVLIEDSFYGTRMIDDKVNCKRKYRVNISVISNDERETVRRLREYFPRREGSPLASWPHFDVKPVANLLFDPLGYIIHVAVAFYAPNLARTARGEVYAHYTDGIDRPLAAKLCRLDEERVEIARRFGVAAETYPQIIARQYDKPLLSDFYDMMQSCRDIYKSVSASSLEALLHSRYVSEDIPALFTMLRLADISRYEARATRELFEEVKGLMARYRIDRAPLSKYLEHFPSVGSARELVELMNWPIPAVREPSQFFAQTA